MAPTVPTLSLLFVLNKLTPFCNTPCLGILFQSALSLPQQPSCNIIVSDFIYLITESLYSYQLLLNSTTPGNLFSAPFLEVQFKKNFFRISHISDIAQYFIFHLTLTYFT